MLVDYFTKPLQGKLFKQFLNIIMGWVHINGPVYSIKELVENHLQDDSNKVIEEWDSKQATRADMGRNNNKTVKEEKLNYDKVKSNKRIEWEPLNGLILFN